MAFKKVLIIGAGLGGLTLAQSLRRSGIEFQIVERDAGPWDRPQGYRLHLDDDAIHAAREVLPPPLFALFEATSHRTESFTTLLGQDLSVLKRLPTHDDLGADAWPSGDAEPVHFNVDRATLRQILMAGMEGSIRFGRKLVSYEDRQDSVIAHFDDGSSESADVIVGADGIRSAVRSQRAPHARTVDAGIQAIYGRIPLDAAKRWVPTETLEDIFTIASDRRKVFLGLGSVRFPIPPDQAPARCGVHMALKPRADYVVCIVGGRREYFPPSLNAADGGALQRAAANLLEDWPDRARQVIGEGDLSSFFLVDMVTSVPCALDRPGRVTLLGDAIHAMTPTLGRGANVAMRDGALLGRALRKAAAGEIALDHALADYERAMLDYGFAVVREAARMGEQRMAQNPLPP